ncbi:MAG: hypothetical protein ABI812_01780 [Betaproteobacteria bacterium]
MPQPDRALYAAQAALGEALARVLRLHAVRGTDPALARRLDQLSAWQARRLRDTYADLAPDPRYTGAIEFFQKDLYGGGDFAQRDADLVRVVPVMTRLLPQAVITTVARAVELNALAHELDRALIAHLPDHGSATIAVPDYCRAYRRTGEAALRARQIALIGEVGNALDRYVRKPMVRAALTMMQKPARAAGLGALQNFLERGLDAFRSMKGAEFFLATVCARETAINDRILGGDDAPFPPP